MRQVRDAIYAGNIIHKRVGPISHALRYKVFSLLIDCDNLPSLATRLKLFSHNRFNLVSLYQSDFGDGVDLPAYLNKIADRSGQGDKVHRFMMLCYPRILGYAFNPITVYFGLDSDGQIRLTVYEVHNTFGQRKTYVLPADPNQDGQIWQQCPKQFFVSPFNKVSGNYGFHLSSLADEFTLGVALKDQEKPVLRAHFRGKRQELTDKGLIRAIVGTGLLTLKVMVGIHFEAARLWIKGLRLQTRPPAPEAAITYFADARSGTERIPLVQHSQGNVQNGCETDPKHIGNKQPRRAPVDLRRHDDEGHDQSKQRDDHDHGRPKKVHGEKHRRPEPVQ